VRIEPEILAILNRSKLEGKILYLPDDTLDRKTYMEVNRALELLGGKWSRKAKGHVFDEDVEELLNDVINFGEVTDKKKEYQYFPTPPDIVKQLIDDFRVWLKEHNARIIELEPGAFKASGTLVKTRIIKIVK
jgi:hypothetical protein